MTTAPTFEELWIVLNWVIPPKLHTAVYHYEEWDGGATKLPALFRKELREDCLVYAEFDQTRHFIQVHLHPNNNTSEVRKRLNSVLRLYIRRARHWARRNLIKAREAKKNNELYLCSTRTRIIHQHYDKKGVP